MPRNWHSIELEFIQENLDVHPAVLAEKLSALYGPRTTKAVYHMQRRLGRKMQPRTRRGTELAEFDERPSGWYAETIGALLLDYPDAMCSWEHYHRYVEFKHV